MRTQVSDLRVRLAAPRQEPSTGRWGSAPRRRKEEPTLKCPCDLAVGGGEERNEASGRQNDRPGGAPLAWGDTLTSRPRKSFLVQVARRRNGSERC